MPSAGQTTVTTIGTSIFAASHSTLRATVFGVAVTSSSSYGALVNVEGLHQPGEYYPIAPGQHREFKEGVSLIGRVDAKGDGGDATVVFGIIERTYTRMRGSV